MTKFCVEQRVLNITKRRLITPVLRNIWEERYSGNQWLQTSDILMFMNFVCDHNGCELGNTRKQQIGMKRFFILCFTPCDTETVLKMVNCFFNIHPDFIGGVPFQRAAGSPGIGSEILFRIDIDHAPTGRVCAWVFALKNSFGFFSVFIVFPVHLGTDKFHCGKSTAKM